MDRRIKHPRRSVWFGLLPLLLVACGTPQPTPSVSETVVTPTATQSVAQRAGGSVWISEAVSTATPAPADSELSLLAAAPATEAFPASDAHAVDVVSAVPTLSVFDYTVQPGDTLLEIAMRNGIPMAAVQLQNNLGQSTSLRAGDSLRIPPAVAWEGASPFWVAYEVAEGDTLSAIADAFGMSLAQLQGANGLADADLLAVGQALILPLDVPVELARSADPQPEPVVELVTEPSPVAVAVASASVLSEPPAEVGALSQAIFRLLNEERARYGLPALSWSGLLATVAQLHAQDCYDRGWCSHTGSDGTTMKDRIIRQGYTPVRWSECWAWYDTAERAVAMWMDEVPPDDPHRRTILSTYLTEVGVGVMPGNGRGYYFIADFGTPAQ